MRGPGLRASLDVRRTWKCPRCGYERRAPGWETLVHCHCAADEPLMHLVETQRQVRPAPAELDLDFEYVPTPEEAAADAAAAAARAEAKRLAEQQQPVPGGEERHLLRVEALPSPAEETPTIRVVPVIVEVQRPESAPDPDDVFDLVEPAAEGDETYDLTDAGDAPPGSGSAPHRRRRHRRSRRRKEGGGEKSPG